MESKNSNNHDENKTPKWVDRLSSLIHHHWNYHGPCQHINIQSYYDAEHHAWAINVAPVFQEVYGGNDDGKKVWTGFIFDVGDFAKAPGVYIEHQAVSSYCNSCSPMPRLMVKGKYKGHPIYLNVWLEPVRETDTVEIIDTIHRQIVPKGEDE